MKEKDVYEGSILRQFGEFAPVGLALLEESLTTLVSFVDEIIEHRGIASKFLNASLSVELGIKSSFDHTEGKGRVFHHGLCPIYDLIFQLVERNDLVDHTHTLCFGCCVKAAHKPNLSRLLLTYDACKIARAETSVEAANLWACLSEFCVFGGEGEVAHKVQYVAAAYGKAVDHGDDGLGERANLLLNVEHIKARHAVAADVAAAAFDVHVAARAEGFGLEVFFLRLSFKTWAMGTSEHYDADAWIFTADAEGVANLADGEGGEGVAVPRAIDADAGNSLMEIEENLFVLLDGFPGSHG